MGLFSLPKNLKNPSAKDLVDSAMINLKLWNENPDSDYLLEFAQHQIEQALNILDKENDHGNETTTS